MSINRDNIVVKVLKKLREISIETDVWLAFAPIKQLRMNIAIQKATELGATKLIPCVSTYTNEKHLNYRNLNSNIIEAAEQCNRLTLPTLENKIFLKELIDNHPGDRVLIFCNESENSDISMFSKISKIKEKYSKWTLLIGPEGGFSDEEIILIKSLTNSLSVSLGRRTLRSDTATTAALFCIQSIIEGK